MNYKLSNAKVYINGCFTHLDLFVSGGKVYFSLDNDMDTTTIDCSSFCIFPGFVDVHTHLREPGFSYKETIKTGTLAAAKLGYNAIFTMPNLNPVPDSVENLKIQTDLIERDAVIKVYPFAAITKGEKGSEIVDVDALSPLVKGFSDDGKGVQNDDMIKNAMSLAKKNDKIIVAHCEDESLLFGGYIHDGEYAKQNGHKGICSASEYKMVERDLDLVEQTGVKYHVCHVSTKETVDLVRKAKKKGLSVTCETGPHYLVLDDSMLKEDGAFKMNPPIRDRSDKLALIEGIKDGTVEMLATDHAPHSFEEKSKGLKGSLNGIVGLETAFPVLYTHLVKTGEISLEKLIEIMSVNPANRFGVENQIKEDALANFVVFDLNEEYTINAKDFLSMGKSSPFDGYKVYGKCLLNFCDGKVVYKNEKI